MITDPDRNCASSHLGNKNRDERKKWRVLGLLAIAELLAMAVWFSASAVVPALTDTWDLSEASQAWLTMSVQIGFVVGAFASTLLNLPDRIPSPRLLALAALAAGMATAAIPWVNGPQLAIFLRFLTGLFLAGVYPVGMKIMATWTKADRGLAIGLLVGALTIGSASPHLLNALGGVTDWKPVLYWSSLAAILGSAIAAICVREGPYRVGTPPFNWRHTGTIFRQKEIALANLGYLGHMWELYAMWTWLPLFLSASFAATGHPSRLAAIASFFSIAAGGLGSLLAGMLADRLGRTTLAIASLAISGSCALSIGWLFGQDPGLLICLSLIWGFAVVADSAQFSAAISELGQPEYLGTTLTMQTCLGFLLTMLTIRIVPTVQNLVGWRWTFCVLALGPVVGIVAMIWLRRLPEAIKLAGGKK